MVPNSFLYVGAWLISTADWAALVFDDWLFVLLTLLDEAHAAARETRATATMPFLKAVGNCMS